MVTRRKYRQPQGYKDGGRIPDTNTGIAEPAPLPHESAAAPLPPQQGDDAGNALVHAHAAQMRAEELQRQAPQKPRTIEEHIDTIPGLTPHKRAFLKQHPKMATDPGEMRAMSLAYHSALSAGIHDDTEEMNQAILGGMQREREVETLVKAPPAEAPPPAPTPLGARQSTS